GDRALGRDEARQRAGNAEGEAARARILAARQHLPYPVDVPGHQVAAESIAGPECRFEVHRRTGAQLPEGGERERLARHVRHEAAAGDLGGSEAAALYADAVADTQCRRLQTGTADGEAQVAAAALAGIDAANVEDDAGEHARPPADAAAGARRHQSAASRRARTA